jgi:hypothetical protein
MNYTHEKNKLIKHIGNNDIVVLLKQAGCFIAGGTITSLFSDKEINDIDVYFKDYKSLCFVLKNLFNVAETDEDFIDVESFALIYTHHTSKSILFTKDGLNVQLIYFKFFNTPQEIFDTFDFTACMGAYDCANEQFVLHDSFLKDVAQRKLVANPRTAFPIISLLRVDKYRQKGYKISRKDFVNLCLSVNRLDLKSWNDLADAIGGMYGYTYTDMFDTTKTFTMDEAISQLEVLETNMDNVALINTGMDYDILMDNINETIGVVPPSETGIFYKKVLCSNEKNLFSSYYHPEFKYRIGEIVNGGGSGIWAYKSVRLAERHYSDTGANSIIKLKTEPDAKVQRDSGKSYNIHGNVRVLEEVKPAF